MANPEGKRRLALREAVMKIIREGDDEVEIRRTLAIAAPRPLLSGAYRIWREEVRRALGSQPKGPRQRKPKDDADRCPNCPTGRIEVRVDVTFVIPMEFHKRFSKEIVRRPDVLVEAAEWGEARFTCNQCGWHP